MPPAYLAGRSAIRVGDDELHDEILGVLTDILPVSVMEDNSAVGALVQQLPEVLTAERGVTAQQSIRDDAHGPHVYGLSVSLPVHDLGGCVPKRAGHCLKRLFLGVQCLGDTEIGEDEVGAGVLGDV